MDGGGSGGGVAACLGQRHSRQFYKERGGGNIQIIAAITCILSSLIDSPSYKLFKAKEVGGRGRGRGWRPFLPSPKLRDWYEVVVVVVSS